MAICFHCKFEVSAQLWTSGAVANWEDLHGRKVHPEMVLNIHNENKICCLLAFSHIYIYIYIYMCVDRSKQERHPR